MRTRHWRRRAASLCLAITILGVHTARGADPGRAALAGSLDSRGRVTIDGQDTITGATFFSGGRIVTADNSEATISLGELGRVRYAPNSAGVLSFADAATGGHLEGGLITVSKPAGVSATFTTKDGAVAAEAGEAAVFSIEINGDDTVVSSLSGRVRLQAAGAGRELAAGESVSLGQGGGASQGNGLSNEERLALGLGIAGVALTIIILIARGDDDEFQQIVPSPSR